MTKNKIRDLVEGILIGGAVKTPPIPIEVLIRRQGISIARKHLADETSGFVYVDAKTDSTVIGLNVSHSKTRQRFTLAHELGHFLMHKTSGGHLHVDEKDFFVRFRDKHSKDGSDQQEREANAFAAELLMPTSFLERDVKHLKDGVSISDEKAIRTMANRYGVSLQALLFRLGNLNLLEGIKATSDDLP
jgi:Zn-dependent peptidase ImmA (M78 family)